MITCQPYRTTPASCAAPAVTVCAAVRFVVDSPGVESVLDVFPLCREHLAEPSNPHFVSGYTSVDVKYGPAALVFVGVDLAVALGWLIDDQAEPPAPGPGFPADWPDEGPEHAAAVAQGVRVDASADLAQLVDQAAAPTVELIDRPAYEVAGPHAYTSTGALGRGVCDLCGMGPLGHTVDDERTREEEADWAVRDEHDDALAQAQAKAAPVVGVESGPVVVAPQEDFPSEPPAGGPLESSSAGNLPVFAATVDREGDWYVIDVRGVGVTQSADRDGAEAMAVDLIAAAHDVDPATVRVELVDVDRDPGWRLPDGRPDTGWERLRPPGA